MNYFDDTDCSCSEQLCRGVKKVVNGRRIPVLMNEVPTGDARYIFKTYHKCVHCRKITDMYIAEVRNNITCIVCIDEFPNGKKNYLYVCRYIETSLVELHRHLQYIPELEPVDKVKKFFIPDYDLITY